jgi:hypothetical protein
MTHINPIKILSLNDLRDNKPERPGWSLTFGALCADAAAVCLDDGGHSIPVTLTIEGIQPCDIMSGRATAIFVGAGSPTIPANN